MSETSHVLYSAHSTRKGAESSTAHSAVQKDSQPGPLFNPFETITPQYLRKTVSFTKFHSKPTVDEFPDLDHETLLTPKTRQKILLDYYPSKVDLPNEGTYESIKNKMRANARKGVDPMDDFHFTNEPDPNKNNNDEDKIPEEIWVPDRALEAINMERQLEPEITDSQLANKILKENLPIIAVGITHTAKYSSDARLRFQAQTYVMDRVLGKVGTVVISEDSPIDDLNKQLMDLVNSMAGSDEQSE